MLKCLTSEDINSQYIVIWGRKLCAHSDITYAYGGSYKIKVSVATLVWSGIEAASCKVCFTTRGLLCYLDFGPWNEITPYSNANAHVNRLFLYLPTELFWLGLWSKQLSHLSSVGSLMCQDPEISLVFIMQPFKRKQFADDLKSGQLLTAFSLPSNSLYFLVTDAL